ncbi:MAG: hypothetical protein V4635_02210 [Bacteroidota bacterium]
MKIFTTLVYVQLIFCGVLCSQNKISNQTGNWSDPTIWTPNGVPTITNNVTISNGNTVTMDVNVFCNTLDVGTGGTAATIRFSGNSALIISVNSNLTISSGSSFRTRTSSNTTHTISIKGNITNNGTLDLARDNNSLVDLIFTNGGNQNFSGGGTLTRLNNLVLNMGTSVNNILDVSLTSFVVPEDFLVLKNGTFKLSGTTALNIIPFTTIPTIPVTAGLWLNSSNAVVTSSTGLNLSGKVTVSAGTLAIGNAADEDLAVSGGTVIVSGGALNIAGKYNATGSAGTFSLGGGTITLPVIGSNNTTIAPFQVTAAGSQFNMSGGTIILMKEGGTGAQDLGFVNTGSTAGSTTGGTLQIGNSLTPAGQIFNINTTSSVSNLVVNSANATAKIFSNNLNISGNVNITAGILNANNLGLSLGGNWANSGTFTPGTGTVNFNSASAQSVFKSGGETFYHLLFSGSGLKTFSSNITSAGNYSIAAGSAVDVSTFNFQLTARGNFINNGTFNIRNGLVLLNGTTTQIIGGTSTTDFFDLTLSNAGGASLAGPEKLIGTLTLSNGTFNTNSQVFTMVSTATATARVAQIAATADISGNVTVQRFAPGGTTGWALIGAPISSALSLSDWDDDIAISCATCPDGNAGGFLSVYSYSEQALGAYDSGASYVPLNTINDPITSGKGYWVYLGDGPVTTNDITLDVTGALRKGNYTIPLNYTNYGSVTNDGWNLIHNPYPSPISWSSLKGATAAIDNAIYVYNADFNSGAGGFAGYVNGVSSPAVAAGGIGDVIPMSQGFYVHSTGATGLIAQESNKISGSQTFLRPNNTVNTGSLLRLSLNGPYLFRDETVLYFEQGATDTFDLAYDAYKMRGQDLNAPFIALEKGTELFQINGIAPLTGSFAMPLKTLTGYNGSYTVSAGDLSNFPAGACISLYDKFTGITTDLRTTDCVFMLSDTTTVSRFELNISINPLNITSSIVQPSCSGPVNAMIIAAGTNSGPWNYYWKSNGVVVKTSLNKSGADTLRNLCCGNFELQVNTAGACDNNTSTFSISPQVIPVAQFNSVDTLFSGGDSIHFNNTSVNAVSNKWFIASPWFITDVSPTHYFSIPGKYAVKLICFSDTGCSDTAEKVVTVIQKPTDIKNQQLNISELVLKTLGENKFKLEQKFSETKTTNLKIYDPSGTLMLDCGNVSSDQLNLYFDLSSYVPGIYFGRLINETHEKTIKLLVQ